MSMNQANVKPKTGGVEERGENSGHAVSVGISGTLDALKSSSATARQETLNNLKALTSELMDNVILIARNDPNENVRKAGVEALGRCGATAAEKDLLSLAADENEPDFIRKACFASLVSLHATEAIGVLGAVIESNSAEIGLRQQAISALVGIGNDAAAHRLLVALKAREKPIKARIARELGNLSSVILEKDLPDVLSHLLKLASEDSESEVRRSCLSAIAKIGGPHTQFFRERFDAENDEKNRLLCVKLIGSSTDDSAIRVLCRLIVKDGRPQVRETAAESLCNISNWKVKAAALLSIVQNENVDRSDLDAPLILRAILGKETAVEDLCNWLLDSAVGASERVMTVIAALIIAGSGGSVIEAGNRLNRYAEKKPEVQDSLQALRIEIGGTSSLKPVLSKLEEHLNEHFQKPVTRLNQMTTENWLKTVRCVYWGFLARLIMSIFVFVVGMGLTIWSVWQFSATKDSVSLWGAGASMVGGLGSMLAIVYAGPLKDIRNSVQDLARANAIFIGFIHSVLQVSHTFSAAYIKGEITFEETAKSNKLIQENIRWSTAVLDGSNLGCAKDVIPPSAQPGTAAATAVSANPPVK